jgi:uncharacterized protein (DUF736 family)
MKMQGGLWKKKTQDGREFLTGPGLFGMQIFVNPVENKTSENSPDYIITMEVPREKPLAPAAAPQPKQRGGF